MEVRHFPSNVPPAAEQSAAYKLFHYHYMVNMHAADRLRESDHEIFGVVMPSDKEFAKQLSKAHDFQYLTVAEMAYVAATEGKFIALYDPNDAVVIYKMIDRHLHDWLNAVKYSDPETIPLEGLHEFDQLAAMMVYVARGHGLVELEDRYEQYKSQRVFRGGKYRPKTMASSISHSGAVFNEILMVAKSRGHDIWKFRRQAALAEGNDKSGPAANERRGSI